MVPVAVSTDTDYCHLSTKLLSPALSLWAFLTISNSYGNIQAACSQASVLWLKQNSLQELCFQMKTKWIWHSTECFFRLSCHVIAQKMFSEQLLIKFALHCEKLRLYRASFHGYSQIPWAYSTHLCATACFSLETTNRSMGTK